MSIRIIRRKILEEVFLGIRIQYLPVQSAASRQPLHIITSERDSTTKKGGTLLFILKIEGLIATLGHYLIYYDRSLDFIAPTYFLFIGLCFILQGNT